MRRVLHFAPVAFTALMLITATPSHSSPSNKFEPAKCSFDGSPFQPCKIRHSYINRASGWMINVKIASGEIKTFRQEDKSKGDPYRDPTGQAWAYLGENTPPRSSFFNPQTRQSIVIRYQR